MSSPSGTTTVRALGCDVKSLDELVALPRRDRDDAITDRRKRALGEPRQRAAGSAEIAGQHVTVKRVDHDAAPASRRAWRCRTARRGGPAYRPSRCACARRRALRGRSCGPGAMNARRSLSGLMRRPSSGISSVRRPAGQRQVFEARLASVERAVNEERLVPACAKTAIEQHDVTRRPADVEARDDAEDLHAGGRLDAVRDPAEAGTNRDVAQPRAPRAAAARRRGRSASRSAPKIDRTDRCRAR